MQECSNVAIDVDFVAEVDVDVEVAFFDILAKLTEKLAVFGAGTFVRAAVDVMRRGNDVGDALT